MGQYYSLRPQSPGLKNSYGNQSSPAVAGTQEIFQPSCFPERFLHPDLRAALFANENEDAGGQRHNVEQKNGGPKIQAEP
jgi:hypothetical protein